MKVYLYKRKGINIPVMHNEKEFLALQGFVSSVELNTIVVLGSWYAGLESMFDVCTRANIYGFDLEQACRRSIKNMLSSRVALIEQNVLLNYSSLIDSILKNKEGVSFLYCDGGNKIKEIELYAPLLKSGDYLGTHDWGVNKDKMFEGKLDHLDLIVNAGATRVWRVK